jgi:hypothetical protein
VSTLRPHDAVGIITLAATAAAASSNLAISIPLRCV